MSIALTTAYAQVDCPACGFAFAVPQSLVDRRIKDGKTVWCPAGGHTMDWGESEATKLRRQLERTRQRWESAEARAVHLKDQADAAERQLRGQKAANTKLRKRVSNGVCPCCRRTFADLGRHMAGQHPDFVAQGAAADG